MDAAARTRADNADASVRKPRGSGASDELTLRAMTALVAQAAMLSSDCPGMLWDRLAQQVDTWPTVALAVAAIVSLLVVVRGLKAAPAPARQRMEQDADSAYKRWVQAVFLVVSGDRDYGHLPRGEAYRMLVHWWEVHGPHELHETLEALEDAGRGDNAWDLVRFVVVARLGAAAGYIDDDESWSRIHPIARRLQATYGSWAEMAQAYVVARRQWKGIAPDGSEDDDGMRGILDNVAHLREGRWARIDWRQPLDPPEPA